MSPFKLVSVVVPAHAARALHSTVTGWQNFQDKIVPLKEESEYAVTQPELTLCKNLPCASTFLTGSSDSFHWEYHWLRNANKLSTPCVTFGLEKALPVGSAAHSHLGAPLCCQLKTSIHREMCFIVIYYKKIMVSNQMQSKAHQGDVDFLDICSTLKAYLWSKTKN